jgi:hypothetical protein
VHAATAEAVRNLTTRALAGGSGASEAMWLLERRFPQEYGQRFSLDPPSDAHTIRLENSLRLGAAVSSNPTALRLMHEAIAIQVADFYTSRASVDQDSGT